MWDVTMADLAILLVVSAWKLFTINLLLRVRRLEKQQQEPK